MSRSLVSRVGLFGVVAWMASLPFACGGSDSGVADNEGSGGSVGGTTGSGGSSAADGGGTGGSGPIIGCTPPNVGCGPDEVCGPSKTCEPGCTSDGACASGQFCSAGGFCVSTGDCGVAGDCAAGEFCASTRKCLPEGSCAADGDCTSGLVCQGSACVPGGGCGGQEFAAEAVAPNMLIVLDRSCSMRQVGDTSSGKPKWTISVEAIGQMTMTFQDRIIWGLALFPDLVAPNCDQTGTPTLPVQPMNETAIQTTLNASLSTSDIFYPDGPCVTNIDTAMTQAATDPALQDPQRRSYVLLITDGMQSGSCGGNARDPVTEQTIKDLFAAGVPTFVVGFGAEIDPAQMNVFADAGGVPSGDPNRRYYEANDAASFQMALDAIAGGVTGCTFELAEVPDNTDDLYVFQDNLPVPRDPTHTAGWDYDPATNQVTFYGGPCDALQAGTGTDIDIVFGCDVPTPD